MIKLLAGRDFYCDYRFLKLYMLVYVSYLGYPYSVVCPFLLNITSFPHGSSCIGMFPCSMPSMSLGLDFSFFTTPISFSKPLMFVGVWWISLGSISPFEVFIYLGSSSLEHSESRLEVARLLGPLLFICGAGGGFLFEYG
jgi:hypothetical protein